MDALDQSESLNQGQLLALGYGQALATAELDWLDSTLSRLPDHLLSEEDTPGDNSPP